MSSSSERPGAPPPVTIGTAGHIDHGKTLLVERLTGMRADRPWERERGMTIDIGYAEMRDPAGRRIGFVDLPGHERFVRNMVAGATGIDLALLVVAADDGVMPQTREHVDILGLLGVRRGVVVLNKADLVEEDLRELALEELREFLAETCLAEAPLLVCSAATGEGVDEVRATLLAQIDEATRAPDPGSFFLAVQRSFAASGFGCIVTGIPAAGQVAVGDELELLPAGQKVRVRTIEVYHEPAEGAAAGHRTALNLAGVHHEQAERGMVVAEPGVFRATRHVAARLHLLPSARRPLRHAAAVRLLTGTLEEMASIYLPAGDALRPGEAAIVEVRTERPVCVRDGAPFIVRTENARDTLGGGRILASLEEPIGRRNPLLVERLARWEAALDDPLARLRVLVDDGGPAPLAALARRAQLRPEAARAIGDALLASGEWVALPGGSLAPAASIEEAARSLRAALEALHAEQPLLAALPVAEVRDRAGLDEARMSAGLDHLGAAVEVEGRSVRLAGHRVELDPEVAEAVDRLRAVLTRARFAPPSRSEWPQATGLPDPTLQRALTLLRDRDELCEVAPGVLYLRDTVREALRLLARVTAARGRFEPVDAKAVLGGISRKWLIPLLEYLDRLGATRRDGNARLLTRRGEQMVQGEPD